MIVSALHSTIVHEVMLADFKFGDFPQNRQIAKLKTSQSFPLYDIIIIMAVSK